jgi:primosomal protein N'
MYVIQVTPLIRGTQLESLSYFSSVAYPFGTFLDVPIRGSKKPAIVTSVQAVVGAKSALKAATFSLRRLPPQKQTSTVPKPILETAEALQKLYPSTLGAILFSLLPPDIKDGSRCFTESNHVTHSEETTPQVLMARFDERYRSYQSHIRTVFANRGSVLFVVPTQADIAYVERELSAGIKDRVVILDGTRNKKKQTDAITGLTDTRFSKLIITTPHYTYTGRADIASIIIEQSASSHYVDRTRPFIDHRDALVLYAKAHGASVILGDTVVRTEDEAKRRQDIYLTYGEAVKRLVFPAQLHVVKQNDKPNTEVPFQLFSPTLIKSVSDALEGRGHVFLYAARRGLAPVVACVDCGYIFRCPDSETPYSLVRTMKHSIEERWFVSSTSGKRVRAADICPACGSWRLKERGVGIQHVYDEWRQQGPKSPVTLLDHLTASTPLKAKKLVSDFFAQKNGGVLIGTQIALPYLHQGLTMSAIVSLDAARSTPTWRADESLFRLLIRLRECSQTEVLIQTRSAADTLIEYASRGATERFYDDEIALRKELRYPPFSTFILLTWSGTAEQVKQTESLIKDTLKEPTIEYYPSPHGNDSLLFRHALIRIPEGMSAERETIIGMLKALPPYIRIEVNPERIV